MKYILNKIKIPALILAVALGGIGVHQAFAATSLVSSLDLGSTGPAVLNLQTFLASNPSIYPERLMTGYFGKLTSKAVTNFQIAYDLPPVGRVGPLTIATFNRLAASGQGIDISAPQMFGLNVNRQVSKQATITWSTSENAISKVFYDTRPITAIEASRSFTEPSFNASYVALSNTLSTNHSVTLPNLIPGVVYYYVAESIDVSGNVTVTVQGSFTSM